MQDEYSNCMKENGIFFSQTAEEKHQGVMTCLGKLILRWGKGEALSQTQEKAMQDEYSNCMKENGIFFSQTAEEKHQGVMTCLGKLILRWGKGEALSQTQE